MYSDWSADFKQICDRVAQQESYLKLLPPKDANEITRKVIFSIKCDCTCSVLENDDEQPNTAIDLERISAQSDSTTSWALSLLRDVRDSVQLDTHDEVLWAIPIITYGLTVPIEHQDIIKHCAHIYCFWLRNLIPESRGGTSGTLTGGFYPRTLRRDPMSYLDRLLFSLCYFFLPHSPEPLANHHKWFIHSLGQSLPESQKTHFTEPVGQSEIQSNTDHGIPSSWFLTHLEVTRLIVQTIHIILSSATKLPPTVWDSLLQFCLHISHSTLSPPLPVPSWRTRQNYIAVTHVSSTTASAGQLELGGSVTGADTQMDVLSVAESAADCVAELLAAAWIQACAHCFPRPQMWIALKECAKVWRHHAAFVSHWSRVVSVLTGRLLLDLHCPSMMATDTETPSLSADFFLTHTLPREMSAESVREAWYRFLYLIGNPVDFCDPQTLVTPIFERCRKTAWADRVSMAPIYMPYVYHIALRGLSAVVDGFLGMQPSFAIGIDAPFGVPLDLYRSANSASPLVGGTQGLPAEVDTDVKKSVYTGIPSSLMHSYRVGSTSGLPIDKGSRKGKPYSTVTNAALSLSSSGSTNRHSNPTGVQTDILTPSLIVGPPTLLTIVTGGNQLLSSGLVASSPTFPSKHQQSFGAPQKTVVPPTHQSSSTPEVGTQYQSFGLPHLRNLATRWLGPESSRCVSYSRPDANSLLRLLGPWLFEAAIFGSEKDFHLTVISSRVEKFPSFNFQVGRAEALGALCRIIIYARRCELDKAYLTRFYLCLYYGLETGAGRSDFVLSTLLFNAIDLLRADLPGINILLPRIFAACSLVYSEECIIIPEYLSTTLLRRAVLHQLMAMVCIPIQFKEETLKCLVPISNNNKDPVSLMDLRIQLCYFVCDVLKRETDHINFQMLLSVSLALLEDTAADEAEHPKRHLSLRSGEDRVDRKGLHTASSFFNTLVPCLYSLLFSEWGSDSVIQHLLEVLNAIAFVRISPPDPMVYRETVRHICEFISKQCQVQSKYHKRQLHSIIVAAYACLSTWLVRHARLILPDRDCLQLALSTIELGISGRKSKIPSQQPIPKSEKQLTPASKRVQDAAESCLFTLISLAGTFPGPTGSATTSTLLVEDDFIRLLLKDITDPSSELIEQLRMQFRYYWSEPGVILGVLELAQCKEILASHGCHGNPSSDHPSAETVMVIRSAFGRYFWAASMRRSPLGNTQTTNTKCDAHLPRPKPWGCFLEKLIATISRNENSIIPSFPESIKDIPLVDADFSIGTLEHFGGMPGSHSREQVDRLKSIISEQHMHVKEIAHAHLKKRLASSYPDPTTEALPPRMKTSIEPSRLLLTHLGYLSINTFFMIEPELHWGLDLEKHSVSLASGNFATTMPSSVTQNPPLQQCPGFLPLDPRTPGFLKHIRALDQLPCRTTDTLLVFYVAAGQTKPEEILSSMGKWDRLPAEFRLLLKNIGSTVSLADHPGWTGRIETSYRAVCARLDSDETKVAETDTVPDGLSFIIYTSDALTELACICPTDLSMSSVPKSADNAGGPSDGSYSSSSVPGSVFQRNVHQQTTSSVGDPGADPTGGRVALVWLERWDDCPVDHGPDCPGWTVHNMTTQLFNCPVTIYIHQLSSKLYRIGMLRAPGRVFDAGPLQTGLVLSARSLGSFVRQTVSNLAQRRRLASDQFQPPHVKRKHRISELEQICRQWYSSKQEERTAPTGVRPDVLIQLLTPAV
ncbi:unnamed protein product [Dicrocoelium dendriticum]|nr:unnamed protein product [Dicrocoelium dendriticum]